MESILAVLNLIYFNAKNFSSGAIGVHEKSELPLFQAIKCEGFMCERKNGSWFSWSLFLCFFLLEKQKKDEN